jgi:hypothetical protein
MQKIYHGGEGKNGVCWRLVVMVLASISLRVLCLQLELQSNAKEKRRKGEEREQLCLPLPSNASSKHTATLQARDSYSQVVADCARREAWRLYDHREGM